MYSAILKLQWKWTRIAALIAVVLGFAIPLTSMRQFDAREGGYMRLADLIIAMQGFGPMYAMVAAGTGLAFALLAWTPDHRGRHVYALSLPVTRARYAMMRFGAGATFLLAPAVAVLLGALITVALVNLPAGLHAYPLSLALRFLLASLVAYSVFFMVAASTSRAAGFILGGIAMFIVVATVLSTIGVDVDLMDKANTLLFSETGLLSVFTGGWMLFDV